MAVDIAKITVWVPDSDALNHVLAAAKVHPECGSPRRDADGSFIVTLYATAAEADKVAALGFRHEIDKKYGDALEKRQKQVSKTDRFEGGKIKPVGLGEKR
jgi:hypothetical protein